MRSSRGRGFTLLEVLVVVTLVAIMGAAVTVSLSSRGDRGLEAAAEGLRDALNHAAETAVATGRAYGLRVRPAGYDMTVYDGRGWRTSGDVRVALSAPYRLIGDSVYDGREEPPAPQMVFMPDGEHHLGSVSVENEISHESRTLEALGGGRYGVAAAGP